MVRITRSPQPNTAFLPTEHHALFNSFVCLETGSHVARVGLDSLCSLGWPRIPNSPTSTFRALGRQVCAPWRQQALFLTEPCGWHPG